MLFVHQFSLARVTGVTQQLVELLEIVPRVYPDIEPSYLALEEICDADRLATALRRIAGEVTLVVGINLQLTHFYQLTQRLVVECEEMSIPLVIYVHDYWPQDRARLQVIARSARILASTPNVRAAIEADGLEVYLTTVGIPFRNLGSSDWRSAGNSLPRPVIASLGRLVERKRFIDVARAYASDRLHVRASLYLRLLRSHVRKTEEDDRLLEDIERALADSTGFPGRVRIDRHCRILRDYSSFDVYVAASSYEGFGMAPIEAAYCGCPPILSDIPAHCETAAILFGRRRELFLYPTCNHQALASTLDDEVRRGRRRKWLGSRIDKIRSRIIQHWSLETVARDLVELL